jgi:hypothetical protein
LVERKTEIRSCGMMAGERGERRERNRRIGKKREKERPSS